MRYQAGSNFAVTAATNRSYVARDIALGRVDSVDLRGHAVVTAYLARLSARVAVYLRLPAGAALPLCKAGPVMVVAKTLRFMWSLTSRCSARAFWSGVKGSQVAIPTPPSLSPRCSGPGIQFLIAISTTVSGDTPYTSPAETPATLTAQYALARANLDTAIDTRISHAMPPLCGLFGYSVLQMQGGVK